MPPNADTVHEERRYARKAALCPKDGNIRRGSQRIVTLAAFENDHMTVSPRFRTVPPNVDTVLEERRCAREAAILAAFRYGSP